MKKVLLVDRAEAAMDEKKRLLNGRGLKVFTARTAEEARTAHDKEKFDLIVADLDLPGMAADRLCALFRNDESLKNVSFIIVCRDSRVEIERCAGCGANAYITKPVDPAKFVEKLNGLLNIPRRSAMRVLLKVSVKGNHKDQAFFCTSVNISSSGVLLEADRVIFKGDMITCSFFVPRSQIVSADCEVMRVIKIAPDVYQYGARFVELPADAKTAIEDFVRRRAT